MILVTGIFSLVSRAGPKRSVDENPHRPADNMKNGTPTGTDFLVIGGGIAGMIFALKASAIGSVTVLTKAASDEANTAYAQGGIASVWSVDDSFESHVEDTLRAGAGLCNRAAVESIVRDGPEAVRELIALGTHFTRVDEGGEDEYDLGREGATVIG